MKFRSLMSCILINFLALSCAPITKVSGYVPMEMELEQLRVGFSTKKEVLKKLGEPLNFQGDSSGTLIFVQQKVETVAFLRPRVSERVVIKLSFNRNDILSNVEKSSSVNNEPFKIEEQLVVSKGRKLSFWQQMFGNIGNFSAEQIFD